MSKDLTELVSSLKEFLQKKTDDLQSNGALTADLNTIKLFHQQIDSLADSAKEIQSNYADNKNILYNFNKRVLEIRHEIDQIEIQN